MTGTEHRPGGNTSTERGNWAEARALELIAGQGLIPLEQNFRQKCGELDLVFSDRNTIVFVEVRYRSSSRWGDGVASITASKRRRLSKAAASWLKRHPSFRRAPCRFDVVSVSGPETAPALKWIRSAFEAV